MKKQQVEANTLVIADVAMQIGIIIGLLVLVGKTAANVAVLVFFLFLFWGIFCSWLQSSNAIKQIKFNGNIDELTLVMARMAIQLKKKLDSHYIYSTTNRLMPNMQYTAREYGDYCVVIGSIRPLYQDESLK